MNTIKLLIVGLLVLLVSGFSVAASQQAIPVNVIGSGQVTGASLAGPCTSDCVAKVSQGSKVVLRAKASPDSYFTGWSGACTGLNACVFKADIDKSVTATFAFRQPSMELSSDNIDFGLVSLGKETTKPFKIKNTGRSKLLVTLSGIDTTALRVIGKSVDVNISPNKTYTFKLGVKLTEAPEPSNPTTENFQSSADVDTGDEGPPLFITTLRIISNDPEKSTVDVPVVAELIPLGMDYTLNIKTDVTLDYPNAILIFKEDGRIPFHLQQHKKQPGQESVPVVDCNLQSKPSDPPPADGWQCNVPRGHQDNEPWNSTFELTGQLTGQSGECSICNITAKGYYQYVLRGSGSPNSTYLTAKLRLDSINETWTACCSGCACREIASLISYEYFEGASFDLKFAKIPKSGSSKNLSKIPPPFFSRGTREFSIEKIK